MNLLIVEDEKIIRNGLMKHMPWKQLGIGDICMAENAVEAMELCREFRPDIILSDIRMPGMNGIEMCRKIVEIYKEVQIIFITGYVEKEYLKAAIDLRAVSYIEKPVSLPETQKAIRQAVENIQNERIRKEAMLHRIMMNSQEAGRYFGEISWCQVFLIHVREEEEAGRIRTQIEHSGIFRQNVENISQVDFVSPRTIAFLIGKREGRYRGAADRICNWMEETAKEWKSGGWFLAAGKEGDSIDGISESYRTAKEAMKSLAWLGWNQCARYPEEYREYQTGGDEAKLLEEFGWLISKKKTKEALEFVEKFYRDLMQKKTVLGYSLYHITGEFQRILIRNTEILSGALRKQTVDARGEFLPEDAETLEELSRFLKTQLKYRMLNGKSDEQEESERGFVVQKVIACIKENYSDPELSILSLAETVYLTPTYLSNVFKKQTGVTIGQFLTDLRMEKAKNLLRDPQYKLYQISELVGYKNQNYFAKIFKKKTGYTPSEYRKG